MTMEILLVLLSYVVIITGDDAIECGYAVCDPVDEYCDTIVHACSPCRELCNPNRYTAVACSQYCPAYISRSSSTTTSTTTNSLENEAKSAWSTGRVVLSVVVSVVVLVLLVLTVVILLMYKRGYFKNRQNCNDCESQQALSMQTVANDNTEEQSNEPLIIKDYISSDANCRSALLSVSNEGNSGPYTLSAVNSNSHDRPSTDYKVAILCTSKTEYKIPDSFEKTNITVINDPQTAPQKQTVIEALTEDGGQIFNSNHHSCGDGMNSYLEANHSGLAPRDHHKSTQPPSSTSNVNSPIQASQQTSLKQLVESKQQPQAYNRQVLCMRAENVGASNLADCNDPDTDITRQKELINCQPTNRSTRDEGLGSRSCTSSQETVAPKPLLQHIILATTSEEDSAFTDISEEKSVSCSDSDYDDEESTRNYIDSCPGSGSQITIQRSPTHVSNDSHAVDTTPTAAQEHEDIDTAQHDSSCEDDNAEFVVENLARSLSDSGYISFSLLDKIEELPFVQGTDWCGDKLLIMLDETSFRDKANSEAKIKQKVKRPNLQFKTCHIIDSCSSFQIADTITYPGDYIHYKCGGKSACCAMTGVLELKSPQGTTSYVMLTAGHAHSDDGTFFFDKDMKCKVGTSWRTCDDFKASARDVQMIDVCDNVAARWRAKNVCSTDQNELRTLTFDLIGAKDLEKIVREKRELNKHCPNGRVPGHLGTHTFTNLCDKRYFYFKVLDRCTDCVSISGDSGSPVTFELDPPHLGILGLVSALQKRSFFKKDKQEKLEHSYICAVSTIYNIPELIKIFPELKKYSINWISPLMSPRILSNARHMYGSMEMSREEESNLTPLHPPRPVPRQSVSSGSLSFCSLQDGSSHLTHESGYSTNLHEDC